MGAHWFCISEVGVRSPIGPPKIYPARLLARSIPFQGIGTGSIPVQDAKVYIPLVLTAARQSPKLLVGVRIPRGMPFLSLIGLAAMPPCLERGNRRFESFMGDQVL